MYKSIKISPESYEILKKVKDWIKENTLNKKPTMDNAVSQVLLEAGRISKSGKSME